MKRISEEGFMNNTFKHDLILNYEISETEVAFELKYAEDRRC